MRNVPSLISSLVSSPVRSKVFPPIGARRYLRIDDFLIPHVAEAIYGDLRDETKFEKLNTAVNISPDLKAFGALRVREGCNTPGIVQTCFDLLAHHWFEEFISRIVDDRVICIRPARAYRMNQGDYIAVHDDLFDPCHRVSVVLNFTKEWRRSYGGNTLVGQAAKVEKLSNSSRITQRWVLDKTNAILTPRFNSLTIIQLKPNLAHAVTTVKTDIPRISVVCIYGKRGS